MKAESISVGAQTSDYIAEKQTELVMSVAGLLAKRGLTVSTAESCTGGILSSLITTTPGASQYFPGAVIAYSNKIKADLLGVPVKMLEQHGAVSEPVARAMAAGVKRVTNSDIGIGITGIAGPDGGTPAKPVGLVYIAINMPEEDFCAAFNFSGDRATVRHMAALFALQHLFELLR